MKFTAEAKEFGECESTIDCSSLTENAFFSVDSFRLANAVKQIVDGKFPITITDEGNIQIISGNFLYIVCQTLHAKEKLAESETKQVESSTSDIVVA